VVSGIIRGEEGGASHDNLANLAKVRNEKRRRPMDLSKKGRRKEKIYGKKKTSKDRVGDRAKPSMASKSQKA